MRRLFSTVLSALLALGVAGQAVPRAEARAKPRIVVRDGVTQPVFSYKNAIRETVYVQSTMDQDLDGDLDLLATDIIRPKETERGLKVPVIYEMSPYYQTLGRGNESETKQEEDGDFVPATFPLFYDNYFVPRGYAVVLQDMRGTRNSEGCMVLGDREELIDAEATINWLNGKGAAFTATGEEVKAEWSSGSVGMIGKSYDGTVANGAASIGIKGLKTIVPIAAISRWYDYMLNNGVQYLNAYLTPAFFSFQYDQEMADDEERGLEWIEATYGENGPCSVEGAQIVARAANPVADYDDFWDGRDYLKDVKDVRASVFLIHGLNDYNVKPNHFVQWWKALNKVGVPRKIWLSQTGHVDPFDFRRAEWVHTLHRWFDYWLHDIDNGIMDEPMVDIEHFPDRWKKERAWPAPGARPASVHLGDKGKLTTNKSASATASFSDDPNQNEPEMASNPESPSASRLAFLSPRLKRDVRISGAITVKLRASIDRPDTNLTALLVDYPSKGTITRSAYDQGGEGISIRPGKESCWGESTPADDGCYTETERRTRVVDYEIVTRGWLDARHHETLRSTSPLVPGQVYRLDWEIFGDDYVFEKGHRLGVIIAGSDFTYTVPDPFHATVNVELGTSKVVLPVVGGTRALQRAF